MEQANAPLFDAIRRAGYTLDHTQPHTMGERFLMQNLTTQSGQKVILLGTDLNGNRVVIKATDDPAGAKELAHERACRALLTTIDFAYQPFHAPEEIAFWSESGITVSVQAYIEQSQLFIERPLEEQFSYALTALKTQASARATTASHYHTIAKTFGIRTSVDYVRLANQFNDALNLLQTAPDVLATVDEVLQKIGEGQTRIEQYCGFLTHTDFVPHNFRIKDGTMYLLDASSLEFGNKHEGWARFLNFMTLYNYKLENALLAYAEHNYSTEEQESLHLMRLYRLIEIITYYSKTIANCDGDLCELNKTRVQFWHNVLQAELQNERVRRDIVEQYKITRDRLRSKDEKVRQQNLH